MNQWPKLPVSQVTQALRKEWDYDKFHGSRI